MAVFNHPQCTLKMHYDERGSAFMALGYGKADARSAADDCNTSSKKPAVWITTSGTALANGFPAIVEADMECVPMILLTADRPPELRDTDANQTIRQDHIFGRTVRWFVDLPAPSDDIDPAMVLTTVDHAVLQAKTGPVHINCMFREPLAPIEEPYSPMVSERFSAWERSKTPFTTYCEPSAVNQSAVDMLHQLFSASERPMVVLGRMGGKNDEVSEAVHQICRQYGAVSVVDVGSSHRLGIADKNAQHTVFGCDLMIGTNPPKGLAPDVVIQFGATPVSKRLNQFVAGASIQTYCIVDDRNRRIDPSHKASQRIMSKPEQVLSAWAKTSLTHIPDRPVHADWVQKWQAVQKGYISALRHLFSQDILTEQAVAHAVSRWLTNDYTIALGSSNPIRHMDSFAVHNGSDVYSLSNRGASGIDGTLASGVGFAMGHQKRPVVFLGDLALLHDLNSLPLCVAAKAVVVVINNDGGGIFSHLPVRAFEKSFEPLFGTPHGLRFEHAARMFGMAYSRPTSVTELNDALTMAHEQEHAFLIEVQTDRESNRQEAERIKAMVEKTISTIFSDPHLHTH